MPLLLMIVLGMLGVLIAIIAAGIWAGAALFFGLPEPSHEQIKGAAIMFGCSGLGIGLLLALIFGAD